MDKIDLAKDIIKRFKKQVEIKRKEGQITDKDYNSRVFELIDIVPEKQPQITNPKTQFLYEVKLENWMYNMGGNVHGGVIGMIIHTCTNISILAIDKGQRISNTSDFSISYIRGILKKDEKIYVLVSVDKLGKTVAFTQAWIYDDRNNQLTVARHIKSIEENTKINLPKL